MKTTLSALAVFAFAGLASAQCTTVASLGSTVNFPGAGCPTGVGNKDLSEVAADGTVAGYNFSVTFGTAEDFVLANDTDVTEITIYAYSTNAAATGDILGTITMTIHDDAAGLPGAQVAGTGTYGAGAVQTSPGIYRTFNAQGTNCARVVRKVVVPTAGLSLPAGTYWWRVQSTLAAGLASGPWMPLIVEPGNNTTTPAGNGKVYNSPAAGQYAPAFSQSGLGVESGFPFEVCGVEQTGCYADCDGNGSLNIFDYICFGNAYSASQAYADCDGNGSFNIFDYICFGNAYSAGCP